MPRPAATGGSLSGGCLIPSRARDLRRARHLRPQPSPVADLPDRRPRKDTTLSAEHPTSGTGGSEAGDRTKQLQAPTRPPFDGFQDEEDRGLDSALEVKSLRRAGVIGPAVGRRPAWGAAR